ncbi:alpha-ketoacid dehydrogenase subunit beta [Rummeliibacillus sp. NPDC094406]|uniref:alpha-ketoacid dehydrogenase subunit beta n=1 Tax=Rummeliibacillus sp. NPDC094406 TaxID=3364511 RepID=UPI003808B861
MTEMTMVQAINQTIELALEKDPSVVLLGEDVGTNGGVFRVTDGLINKFGKDRIIDTPLAESAIIGTAFGMSINGLKPIAEIQFMGFIYEAMDQIASQVARIRFKSAGRFNAPLVIRSPYGGGVRAPELHSDSLEALFSHTPGLKVVMPSNAYDAKGLLLAAIEDEDPVLFLEPMKLYRAFKEEVPDHPYTIPIGKAATLEEGNDITIVSWGPPIILLKKIVQIYKQKGISIELIDLRTIAPLDIETIVKSVTKTERLVIVHEAVKTNGVGAEIAALISERAIFSLVAPIIRVTGFDSPYPVTTVEEEWLPNLERISDAIDQIITYD